MQKHEEPKVEEAKQKQKGPKPKHPKLKHEEPKPEQPKLKHEEPKKPEQPKLKHEEPKKPEQPKLKHEETKPEQPKLSSGPEYESGWDAGSGRAWRKALSKGRSGPVEWSMDPEVDESRDPLDPIVCVFADGMAVEIPHMTQDARSGLIPAVFVFFPSISPQHTVCITFRCVSCTIYAIYDSPNLITDQLPHCVERVCSASSNSSLNINLEPK